MLLALARLFVKTGKKHSRDDNKKLTTITATLKRESDKNPPGHLRSRSYENLMLPAAAPEFALGKGRTQIYVICSYDSNNCLRKGEGRRAKASRGYASVCVWVAMFDINEHRRAARSISA